MKITQTLEERLLVADWFGGLRRTSLTWEANRALQIVGIAVVTVVAAGLRLYKLGQWSFWGDEVITLGRAESFLSLPPQHWSVTRLLTYISLQIFGVSEWSARLAPAVLGILTIPVMYLLVRKIWGRSVGILAVSLLAISTWHVYWSQNARFYTALLLFYALGMLLLYRGLEEDRPAFLAMSLVMFGLSVQERLIALMFVPVIAIYLLAIKLFGFQAPKGIRLRNLLIFIIPGLLIAVLLPLLYPIVRQPSLWLSIFGRINSNPLWILSGVVYYVGIPVIGMAIAGAAFKLRQRDRSALFLTVGVVVPLAAIMFISMFHFAANRYLFETLPFWIILASIATVSLIERISGYTRVLAVGGLLILVLSPLSEDFLYYRYQNGNRDDWRSAFAYVESLKKPDDLVISANRLTAEYYMEGAVMTMNGLDKQDLDGIVQRTWFVQDMNVEERYPDVLRWIDANAQLMANFDVHVRARIFKMRVYLYDPTGG